MTLPTNAHASASLIEDKLSKVQFINHADSHLAVRDQQTCRRCVLRPCVDVCPGAVYDYSNEEGLSVAYENCLECGSCKIVCEFDNIEWNYPPGGFGVDYQWG
ncbi:MAG TPA: 4Fe-4S dicluster domain-containing protein [Candidatus Hydrogenedentes bacterium]|nr:4Fe-4S dicluster domain-containing protein [Candidatus Hydrogenedentota bacterium]